MEITADPAFSSFFEARLQPLRNKLDSHPLYQSIRSIEHIRTFMESHVFAVWDFMSLLKSLQRTLTCVQVPWIPTAYPASRRFINEIVFGEESDQFEGRSISHFELYLEAMKCARADTQPMRAVITSAEQGYFDLNAVSAPPAAKKFVEATFHIIRNGSPAAQAAAFAFGREDSIPLMFRRLVQQLNIENGGRLDTFAWYLQRHIEVDDEDHGPLALNMVHDLCGSNPAKVEEAASAAEFALRARIQLWDGILNQIHQAQ